MSQTERIFYVDREIREGRGATIADVAERFEVSERPREKLRLGLRVNGLVSAAEPSQKILVTLGEETLPEINLTGQETILEIEIPREAFSPENKARIVFRPVNPINPVQAQLPYWTYNGKLSFCLREIMVKGQ